RDFKATSEPSGRKGPRRKGDLAFVVQKHAARNLHYDFRLEWDGVLLSWAVPKGPVPDPSVKRLAMRTEDHPLSYADFEGIIPRGEYGGGTVMVWDRGRWTPRDDPEKGLKKGRLDFDLEGEKLRGRWTLVRSAEAEEKKEPWLLFKRNDEAARPGTGDLVLEEQSLSVLTGRSLEEIAEDRERIWRSGEKEGGSESRDPKAQAVDPSVAEGARRRPLPSDVGPQLATLVKHAPEGEAWLHEIKYDGYRLLCRAERDDQDDGELRVRLATRNALDWTERFPRLARAAGALPVKSAILDGEAVVMDRNGRSDFQALQQALASPGSSRILFYAFDLLHLDGWDLRRAPQIQ
ncbi:MAG: DNA polymerase ligase N-terminal domain-containing protein, partial [Phycisphaeraceae bacterium]